MHHNSCSALTNCNKCQEGNFSENTLFDSFLNSNMSNISDHGVNISVENWEKVSGELSEISVQNISYNNSHVIFLFLGH